MAFTIQRRVDYSQYGQPLFFRQFLPPEVPSFLVDVGAHDGFEGSNSRELLLNGWSGILLEPMPLPFEALKKNCEGMERVTLHNLACADYDGAAELFIGLDGPQGQTSSLCNEPQWVHNHSGTVIRVAVRTLTSILEANQCPSKFGLLLVDAEGMDLEVLRGIDLNRFRPAVICTEQYQSHPEKDRHKNELLRAAGYEQRGIVGVDTIWTCNSLVGDRCLAMPDTVHLSDHVRDELSHLPVRGEGSVHFDALSIENGTLKASGWAFACSGLAPEIVIMELTDRTGATRYVQATRHPRFDVARHFQDAALRLSGFRVSADGFARQLVYKIALIQVTADSAYQSAIYELPCN
jgi:FkbM family methyltransferase